MSPHLCRFGVAFLGLAISVLVVRPVRAAAPTPTTRQVLVKFRSAPAGARLQDLNRLPAGARVSRTLSLGGWQVIDLPAGTSARSAVDWFRARPEVVQAEPNVRWHLHAVPNDPQIPRLFGLERIGAPAAWDRTRGSTNVVVAVLDTGITADHPDLAPNLWRNPGEIPDNGLDDDQNGKVDDLLGWDFLEDDADPHDDAGHGTHVAGTIGAVGDNGLGVAGVCWQVQLMTARVGSVDDFASTAGLVEAFAYVARMRRAGVNVRVINCSWGGGFPSAALREAICEAADAGILVVCSAGNDRQDNDALAAFPSGYDCPGILSVASSTSCDDPSSFSNFGRTTVDLAAPGSGVLSTYRGGRYAVMSGTSMAAPHVTGAAALLLAFRPDLTVREVRDLLLATVDRLPGWEGRVVSGGRLNLDRAMQQAASGGVPTPPALVPGLDSQRITAVSRSAGGRWGNANSLDASISADGRWVAFASAATNLVDGDAEGFGDIFLRDRLSNTVVRVSRTQAGVGGNGDSSSPAISADGRFVAFVSAASNLVAGDGNRAADVFVWDRHSGGIELISQRRGSSNPGGGASELPAISADGSIVAFASEAADLVANDRNNARDVFIRDRQRGATERVSVAGDGSEARGWSDAPSITGDGRYVAFHSSAPNLVDGDANQAWDVFVRDRRDGRTELASVASDGVEQADRDSVYPILSADGRYLMFGSLAGNLDRDFGDEFLGLFLRDRVTGAVTRLGAPPDGSAPTGDVYGDAASSDGRYLTFTSDDPALAPGGAAGLFRVFVHDRLTGGVEPLAVSGAGYGTEDNAFIGRPSADGRFVVFASYGFNLAAGDGNGVADVFVVDRGAVRPDLGIRVHGTAAFEGLGFPNPSVPQRGAVQIASGTSTNAEVRLINGGGEGPFRLRLSPVAAPGWSVRVSQAGGPDLTPALAEAGWLTPVLSPGGFLSLRLEVFRTADGDAEPTFAPRLVVSAAGDDGILDAVSLVAGTDWRPPGASLVSRGVARGRPADRNAEVAAVGAEGARIVFSSDADHLDVRSDVNFQSDVFLVDRTAGTIRRVSDASPSTQGDADSRYPSISADGTKVAFQSRSTNLVPRDENQVEDVFVREVDTGAIERASQGTNGEEGNRGSEGAVISGNGRFVVYGSFASNLVVGDTNAVQDVFVRDLASATTECASRIPGGAFGNGDSEGGVSTADGRWIAFTTYADNLGPVDRNGFADVYLLDRQTGTLELVSANGAGEAADGPSGGATLSDDGRWVAFFSYAGDLVNGADPRQRNAYLLDRRSRSIRLVADLVPALPDGLEPKGAVVSPDGRWLGLAAVTGCPSSSVPSQVFAFDRTYGRLHAVSVRRDGRLGDDHSLVGRFDAGGRYLAFESMAPNLRLESGYPAGQVYLADLARASIDPSVRGSGAWRGEGVTNDVALQTAVQIASPGSDAAARFEVRLRNDGNTPDRLRVRAAPAGPAPASVRIAFFTTPEATPGSEVSVVSAEGWLSPVLASGQSLVLFATVTFGEAVESEVLLDVIVSSDIDPLRSDAVRLSSWLDADADGMPDGWERRYFGGLGVAGVGSDGDGDGASDAAEWEADTDPTNPASRFAATLRRIENQARVEITWPSAVGRYYLVERKNDGTGFVPLSDAGLPADGTTQRWEDALADGPADAVYRVRVDRP